MKITIIGYGRMGIEIEKVSRAKGVEVVSTIDPTNPNAKYHDISKKSIGDADVCIDFTTSGSVVENVKKISALKKNLVVGTTGWYDKINAVKSIVQKNKTGLVYASNFSIGVNAFFRIVENAAKIMDKLEDYDVYGYELHHNKKIDSPSGTAKTIAEVLVRNIKRKKELQFDKVDRKINQGELHFASIRAGSIPGTHVVGFDSIADTIELKHTARNSEGFALGALIAAQWICKKRGFYTINDMMESIIK